MVISKFSDRNNSFYGYWFISGRNRKNCSISCINANSSFNGGECWNPNCNSGSESLATRQLSYINLQKFVLRESWVGMFNGVLFAIFSSILAYFWFNDFQIAIIMSASMVVNLLLAGILGTLIPLSLNKFKIDPAISSTILLTTATDVIGFFTFLGLAAWVIL